MKYYIIAGEASGDLHASNLIKSILKVDSQAEFRGFGGDKMKSAGAHIQVHYSKMAYMGAIEVLMNLKHIKENFKICYADILNYKPDAVILVDYAGFNLRIAKFAKENNIKTLFYISPKVWAWKKSRIKKIKAFVDQLYLILPFEKEFFISEGYSKVEYVGNPLTDAIAEFKQEKEQSRDEFIKTNKLNNKPIVALLAGSRKQEIKLLLPDMLSIIKNYPEYQFVIAGAPSLKPEVYHSHIKNIDVALIMNQTYDLLENATAAIVTSGTATLETALFKVPQVVMYRFHHLSYILFRPFIWLRVKYISLVNLIMDKEVVKECLQHNLAKKVKNELDKILFDTDYKLSMLRDYEELNVLVGDPGTSDRTAKHIINYLSGNK
jgi:lipid-A-disaccharide synthase